MDQLVMELKQGIVSSLKLVDVQWDQIDTDAPLFVEGLGLDSIDALELLVFINKKYGIAISSPEEGRKVLQSVRSMADYITQHRGA